MHFGAFGIRICGIDTGCPEGLYKFWMGHADQSMSTSTTKSGTILNSVGNGLKSAVSASNCPQLYRMYRKRGK